jgi:hypothetical protein
VQFPVITGDIWNLSPDFPNDRLRSIRVTPGYTISVFEGANYTERNGTFTEDTDLCTYGGGFPLDVMSALHVVGPGSKS